MRKLYIYQVLRYYPNIRGDEFFNIGIKLNDSNKNTKIKFIENEHFSYLYRFPSIEKKVIESMIEKLKQSENGLNTWYGNYIRVSEERIYRSDDSFDIVLNNLYNDFIGYKFNKKEKIDTILKIKKDTQEMIEKNFKNYLTIEENSIFDFVVYDKKNIKHLSDLGSITNKLHVNKMIWQREETVVQYNSNMSFDFLNISNDKSIVAENLLNKNEVKIVSYFSDDDRYTYFKNMVA